MTGSIWRAAKLAAALLATAAFMAFASGTAIAALTPIYNNIASPAPGNVVSQGYECCQAAEFGGQVKFEPAPAGKVWKNPKVTVLMSSWGCEEGSGETCKTAKGAKFEWPITVSIYTVNPDNSPGSKIAAASRVFKIPYRPSASVICKQTSSPDGWYDKQAEHCYNGFAAKIALSLKVASLPEKAIISVAYNTSDYGVAPQRPKPCNATTAGCPYDSLNVGAEDAVTEQTAPFGKPLLGSYPLPEDAYFNTGYGPFYCDGGAGGTSTFRLDAGCWGGYQPSFAVSAKEG
ncbi:MAG: hypothetical protein ACHQHO_12140 [Solirubrobacterales bacterium]